MMLKEKEEKNKKKKRYAEKEVGECNSDMR